MGLTAYTQMGLFSPMLGYHTLWDFCRVPGKLSTNRIVRERLQFLKRIWANQKCLETLHKAPAHSSKVEPMFGSGCWLGCVHARVLGFVEFCVPTLHLWGRGGLKHQLVADSRFHFSFLSGVSPLLTSLCVAQGVG